MRRYAGIGGIGLAMAVAGSLAAHKRAEPIGEETPEHEDAPVVDHPKPEPKPETRQQRRAREREDMKDPRRHYRNGPSPNYRSNHP